MRIQYASDLHLEFSENSSYLKHNPLLAVGDVLVLAGDIGYIGDDNYSKHPFWDWASQNYKQVIVIPGNHEFYKLFDLEITLPQSLSRTLLLIVHKPLYSSLIRKMLHFKV